MYEGGHRVPGIVWAPSRVTPGKCSELIMGMDIMPTSLAISKIEPPQNHQFDGVDAGPALFESKQLAERTVIWGRDANGAIRRGPWKLVKDELYNLDNDPQETTNLATRFPKRATQMKRERNQLFNQAIKESPYD